MHTQDLIAWSHDHVFDQDQRRAGETRTIVVVGLTAVMMVVEISTGLIYHSMALLADGLHMASHATALGISAFAYAVSRRLAADTRFAFGVGKINSLAGFASAVLLLGFALVMAIESTDRLFNPIAIGFDQALVVAVIGLLVNGLSAWVLMSTPHEHAHEHTHEHAFDDGEHTHDHNLRAAYTHVLADALTSLLAIVALLAGKFLGAGWLDPIMGIVGAALITRWSYGLICDTARVLLDSQAGRKHIEELRASIEGTTTDRVTDLHVWSVGHNIYAAEVVLVSDEPQPPAHYKARMRTALNIVHAAVEVHRCPDH